MASCTLPLRSTPFLVHGSELSKGGKLPVTGTWVGDEQRLIQTASRAEKILIREISSEYAAKAIDDSTKTERAKRYRKEELVEVVRYMKESFRGRILARAVRPIEIVEEAGPNTLILELALVEVIPTGTAATAIGTVGGFLLPGSGILASLARGTVAMEGRVRDAETGEVLFEFKDRSSDRVSLFSIKDYQEYGHIRAVISRWADEYARLQAQNFEGKIPKALPFTFDPF